MLMILGASAGMSGAAKRADRAAVCAAPLPLLVALLPELFAGVRSLLRLSTRIA